VFLKVIADALEMVRDLDSHFSQLVGWPNARQHQDLR